ncbi:MAG: YhbY family RNA-binding protein [Oscillospiraceae bacterium]|mgnify:FL=1|nr:YhbY family RNA-binding protein [Oscillospiraceae bacterium]
MLTSKQRAALKSIASTEDTILQVGKNGIVDTLVIQVSDALKAREIIKMKVLEGAMLSPAEAAAELAEKTKSEVVQVIGNKIVLFKRNPQNPKIKF